MLTNITPVLEKVLFLEKLQFSPTLIEKLRQSQETTPDNCPLMCKDKHEVMQSPRKEFRSAFLYHVRCQHACSNTETAADLFSKRTWFGHPGDTGRMEGKKKALVPACAMVASE